jgi:hypothetical protein
MIRIDHGKIKFSIAVPREMIIWSISPAQENCTRTIYEVLFQIPPTIMTLKVPASPYMYETGVLATI